jgi:peptide/nickel transport system substrate-binding protein
MKTRSERTSILPALLRSREVSRRDLLKHATFIGLSATAVPGLLAACADQDDGDEPEVDPVDDGDDEDPGVDPVDDDSTTEPAAQDVLIVAQGQDILTLDPVDMRDVLATEVSTKIASRLVKWETGDFTSFVGELAEDWEVTDDGLEWTFHLHQGVQWHKGYGEVTAEDVRFSFLRHKDEQLAARFISEARPIQDVESVDDFTVRIHMSEPYPEFFPQFAAYRPGFIVNQQAMEDLGDRYSEEPIGSGPFIFEEWSPEDQTVLVRNDDYFGESGQFSGIRYVIIREEATLEVALERGEVDVCYFFDPEIQRRMQEHPEINVDVFPGPRTFFIRINLERPPLDDVRIRQALWYALDKQLLVDEVLEGFAKPTDTLFNEHIFGRLEESPYSYDPDQARELLGEAGYPDGLSGITLTTYPDFYQQPQALAMQDMWREVGIDVDIDIIEWALVPERRSAGDYDLDYGPILRLGADQYAVLMHSDVIPTTNVARYRNPEMDALIDQARVTPDDDERRELYHEIQRLMHRDVPYIPVLNPDFVLAFGPDIQGARADLLIVNATEISRVR